MSSSEDHHGISVTVHVDPGKEDGRAAQAAQHTAKEAIPQPHHVASAQSHNSNDLWWQHRPSPSTASMDGDSVPSATLSHFSHANGSSQGDLDTVTTRRVSQAQHGAALSIGSVQFQFMYSAAGAQAGSAPAPVTWARGSVKLWTMAEERVGDCRVPVYKPAPRVLAGPHRGQQEDGSDGGQDGARASAQRQPEDSAVDVEVEEVLGIAHQHPPGRTLSVHHIHGRGLVSPMVGGWMQVCVRTQR